MWVRGVVALFLCMVPVIAIYALGYAGVVELPESVTSGLPRQILLNTAFMLVFGLLAWLISRNIVRNIKKNK